MHRQGHQDRLNAEMSVAQPQGQGLPNINPTN